MSWKENLISASNRPLHANSRALRLLLCVPCEMLIKCLHKWCKIGKGNDAKPWHTKMVLRMPKKVYATFTCDGSFQWFQSTRYAHTFSQTLQFIIHKYDDWSLAFICSHEMTSPTWSMAVGMSEMFPRHCFLLLLHSHSLPVFYASLREVHSSQRANLSQKTPLLSSSGEKIEYISRFTLLCLSL